MKLGLDEAIAKAIDEQNARLAGIIADGSRAVGKTYAQLLARVQTVRPGVTAAEWDSLLSEADDIEASS